MSVTVSTRTARRARGGTQLPAAEAIAVRATLRRAGLRVTLPRTAVLGSLRRAAAPASHGDVAAALVGQGLDRATIYRVLLDLVRARLVRRTDLGDHVWRFELVRGDADAGAAEDHPHFVCNTCGTVECLDEVTVRLGASTRAPRALRRQDVEVLVKGRCDRCE